MIKQALKGLLRRTPYRIVRAHQLNRFDAIYEMLSELKNRGFCPARIIDGGANIGNFSRNARHVFPNAEIDLIEPQPACYDALKRFERENNFFVHHFALVAESSPGQTISLAVDPNGITTGAHIALPSTINTADVPTVTLDQLLDAQIGNQDRVFIKLDLQGYELEALKGASNVLRKTEVILTEVSFFSQVYEPSISQVIRFLDGRGFFLYEIAALSPRSRDGRARQGDFIFVHRDSILMADNSWA